MLWCVCTIHRFKLRYVFYAKRAKTFEMTLFETLIPFKPCKIFFIKNMVPLVVHECWVLAVLDWLYPLFDSLLTDIHVEVYVPWFVRIVFFLTLPQYVSLWSNKLLISNLLQNGVSTCPNCNLIGKIISSKVVNRSWTSIDIYLLIYHILPS